MAVQVVGYWEDEVAFEHGPFVVCRVSDGYYRIEVEVKGERCSCLCDASIYKMLRAKTTCPEGCTPYDLAPWVEWLNNCVRDGQIVLAGNTWVAPNYLGTGPY